MSKTPEQMATDWIIDNRVDMLPSSCHSAFLAGYKAAQASNNELWAIKTPNFGHTGNLLESSEALAWAKLYTIHTNSKHLVPPSRVPPDFIRGLKDIGYKAVRLMEAPNE